MYEDVDGVLRVGSPDDMANTMLPDLLARFSGARVAVRAGLGVMARSVELYDDDLRILSEADELPRLPAVRYHLYMNKYSTTRAASVLFDSLRSEQSVMHLLNNADDTDLR